MKAYKNFFKSNSSGHIFYPENRTEISCKTLNVMLEKDGNDHLDRTWVKQRSVR